MNVLILLLILSFGGPAIAQQPATVLRGNVVDDLGGLVVGARIILVDEKGVERETTSDSSGNFSWSGIAPGTYVLRIEAPGFSMLELRDVVVVRGRTRTLNSKLSVAPVRQEVTVPDIAAMDTSTSRNNSGLVLRSEALDALPDDPDSLAAALKALAGPSAGPSGGELLVDGFAATQMPSKASIREIRVSANPFSAEYNRLGFGRVEVFTKPGTDSFRGQGFFNTSFSGLNSRNPFTTERQKYRYYFFGGSLSGPIIKKRASFFADINHRDIDENNVFNAVVLDPLLQPVSFAGAVVAPQRRTTISGRFDYQINQNHTFTARYAPLFQKLSNAGVGGFSLPSRAYDVEDTGEIVQLIENAILSPTVINELRFQYIGERQKRIPANDIATLNVLESFIGGGPQAGDATVNTLRFELQNNVSFARNSHTFRAGVLVRHNRVNDVSRTNFNGTFVFSGGLAPVLDGNNQIVLDQNGNPLLSEITSIERYRRTLLFQQQGLSPELVRELGGGASQYSINGGDPKAQVQRWEFGVFLQDEWAVRRDLTVSAGLRYEHHNHINSKYDFAPRVAFGYAPILTNKGAFQTVIRGGFGIFYDTLNESFVLQTKRFDGQTQQQFITSDVSILDSFPVAPPAASLANVTGAQTIYRLDPDLLTPYILQGVVAVEQLLPGRTTLSVAYLGARQLHSFRSRNINAPLPGGDRPLGADQGNIFLYESTGRFNQNQLIVSLRNSGSSKFSFWINYALNRSRSDTDGPASLPVNSYDLSGEYGRSALDIRQRLDAGGVITLKRGWSLNPFVLASSGRPFNVTTGRDINGDTIYAERPSFAVNPNQPDTISTSLGLFNLSPLPGEELVLRNFGTSAAFFSVNLRVSKTIEFGRTGAKLQTSPARTTDDSKSPPADRKVSVGSTTTTQRSDFFGKTSAESRYKLTFSILGRNLFNRTNPGISIGNLSSPLFDQANSLAPPFGFGENTESSAANRRLELQVRLIF